MSLGGRAGARPKFARPNPYTVSISFYDPLYIWCKAYVMGCGGFDALEKFR